MSKLREIRKKVYELLAAAYLADDISQISLGLRSRETAERLRTMKEMARLCGIREVERRCCANCGGFLPFGLTYRYCNNACKQSAYRKRNVL